MNNPKKYCTLLLIFPLVLFFTVSLTSCDPHRKGAVSGQMGAKKGLKHHSKPASAKGHRKNKY